MTRRWHPGIAIAASLLLTGTAFGQHWVERYVATELSGSSVQNESRVFLGARAGWAIDRRYIVGGAVHTLVPQALLSGAVSSRRDSLSVIYGGPTLGYTLFRTQLFEVSVNILFGLGGLGLRYRDPQVEARRYDMFVTLQPEILLLASISSGARIFAAGSYRYVTGITTIGYSDDVLSKPGAAIGLLFSL